MVCLYDFFIWIEFSGGEPRCFLISTFIALPAYEVLELASLTAVVITRVKNSTYDVECISVVIVFGWGWWFLSAGEWVVEGGFKLGDMEYRVDL
jgi:hypothetical protein